MQNNLISRYLFIGLVYLCLSVVALPTFAMHRPTASKQDAPVATGVQATPIHVTPVKDSAEWLATQMSTGTWWHVKISSSASSEINIQADRIASPALLFGGLIMNSGFISTDPNIRSYWLGEMKYKGYNARMVAVLSKECREPDESVFRVDMNSKNFPHLFLIWAEGRDIDDQSIKDNVLPSIELKLLRQGL